jgi:signal peptidase I
MEGYPLLSGKPKRGDIVAFKTAGLELLPGGEIYCKRVVGEPGDRLRLLAGKLYVNDQLVTLRNAAGEIQYVSLPGSKYLRSADMDTVTVPEGQFFILGDNSSNSVDSRFFGCVPAGSILGRITFCYWPPGRMGSVK